MQGPIKGANATNAGEEHQPDVLAALNAAIDADQAKRASWTPQQHKAAKRYYDQLNVELDRLTARKRTAGLKTGRAVDFSTEWKQAGRAAAKHATSPTQDAAMPVVTTVARPRERRERHIARSSSSGDSGGDSDEPVPPSAGRFCDGCGRDISHRRADARTCGATCRKRVERGVGLDDLLDKRREAWRDAARDGGHRDLTYALNRDLEALYAEVRDGERADIVQESRLDELDSLMRSNGTYVRRRPVAKEWRTRLAKRDPVEVIA